MQENLPPEGDTPSGDRYGYAEPHERAIDPFGNDLARFDAHSDEVANPSGGFFRYRDGDTVHVEYAFEPATGQRRHPDRYWVTSGDGHILGGGKCEHDPDGRGLGLRFLTWEPGGNYLARERSDTEQSPVQRPDAGDDLRVAPRRDAGADRGAGRPAEPPGGGGEPRQPGAADRGGVPVPHPDMVPHYGADADHTHDRPFRHAHPHQHTDGTGNTDYHTHAHGYDHHPI